MKQYMLLLKGKMELDYSETALGKRMDEYHSWIETIEDHYVSDNRLERQGAHVVGKNKVKVDGPFLEAKEIIAGFIIVTAEDLNQATKLASSSPLLQYFEIYVRPMVPSE